MSIVGLEFLCFLAVLIVLYFLLPRKCQPVVLLLASLAFYCWMSLPQLAFLLGTIATTYCAGRLMQGRSAGAKRAVLAVTLALNIGTLFAVKYLGYMLGLGARFGLWAQEPVLSLLVPLGIAFYTLQAVGYCIDVYRGSIQAEKNVLKYALFMSYFPLLLQGPISRYDQLAGQLTAPHRFDYERVKSGLSLIAWGFFKKLVIADRAALLVNQVFGNSGEYAGLVIVLAVLAYTLQLYADFSGCVDICRGVSELLGIELVQNFRQPYFAVSIADFWRRWHISLSSWLRDYVYIPLGGNRRGKLRKYLNVLLVFFVSGLWHGVGLHYLVWGLLHGFYQVFGALTAKLRGRVIALLRVDKTAFSFRLGQQLITFALVALAWLFFRAENTAQAVAMLRSAALLNPWVLTDGSLLQLGWSLGDWLLLGAAVPLMVAVSRLQQTGSVRARIQRQNLWFRWGLYLLAVFAIVVFGVYGPGYDAAAFIYMQF